MPPESHDDSTRESAVPAWSRRIAATFRPRRTDNLRTGPGTIPIGYRGEWRGLWVVDEDDGGDYVGQIVWQTVDTAYGHWVPDEDLTDVEVLDAT